MSSQGNGSPIRYRVIMSAKTRSTLRQQFLERAQSGEGKEFIAALRQIYERLRDNPVSFGDPLFRLPALNLIVYQAMIKPIIVEYGVHE